MSAKELYLLVATVTAAIVVTGCASARIVARETNPREVETFANVLGWSWGLEGGRTEIEIPGRSTLGSVEIHSNYWYAWGTVLSFGLWNPFDLTYEVNQ